MKRVALGLLWAIGGFVVATVAAYLLVQQLSSNTHDRSVEAAMTSVFFFGPIGAIVAFIVGFIRSGRRSDAGNAE